MVDMVHSLVIDDDLITHFVRDQVGHARRGHDDIHRIIMPRRSLVSHGRSPFSPRTSPHRPLDRWPHYASGPTTFDVYGSFHERRENASIDFRMPGVASTRG